MTDLGNQRIVRISAMAGASRAIFNTVGQCTFTWSPGIFVNARGEIFVADYGGSRIMHATVPPAAPEPKLGDSRPSNCIPPPATTGPQRPISESETNPIFAQDEAKGVYRGPLGDFVVDPRQWAARPAQNHTDRPRAIRVRTCIPPSLVILMDCGSVLTARCCSLKAPSGNPTAT